jgi:multiple sugar transport system ATP-binding protein
MNFMQGQVQRENGHVNVRVGDFNLKPSNTMEPVLKSYEGKPILMGIRAENMETLSKPAKDALQVEVLVVEPLGSQNLLTVKIGNDLVKVSTHPTFRVTPGMDVWLRFPGEKIRWVDGESGQMLFPSTDA